MGPKINFKKNDEVSEFRCFSCGKLLAKNNKIKESFEVKCVRCGTLNSIFNGITEQIVITDPNGVILYTNSSLESITGYKLHEVLGKTPAVWGGQMSKDFYKKLWTKVKTKKQTVLVKVKNKKKNGTFYKAKLKISPVFNVKNQLCMLVGIETVVG